MPNYCHNELYFEQHGALEAVIEFMGDDFDFNKLIPYPKHFSIRDTERYELEREVGFYHKNNVDEWSAFIEKWGDAKDGYNSGGYEWCRLNWGTKWNACKVRVEADHIVFETAWGPPVPIILELAIKFPQYTFYFEYFERGMQFCGGFTCPNRDDYYSDNEWEPGMIVGEWGGKYDGHKGG